MSEALRGQVALPCAWGVFVCVLVQAPAAAALPSPPLPLPP